MFKKKKNPFQSFRKEIELQAQRDKIMTFYYRMTIPRRLLPMYFKNPKFKYSVTKMINAIDIDYFLTEALVQLINNSQRKSPPFYTSLSKDWFEKGMDRYGTNAIITIAFNAPVCSVKKMYKVFPEQIVHVYLQIEGVDIPIIRGRNK